MKLDTYHGSPVAISSLKGALVSGSLPHAVLLAAPDGCGRNFAARCLAADYLFPKGGPGAEAVMNGESPEVLLVEGEGKSGQIPVARIRAVRSDVFLSALSAAGRVVLIRDAHHMAAPAANALLKVLEEPPADVLFILTTQSPASLPATIASRCAIYTLEPLDAAACATLLGTHPKGQANQELIGLLSVLYDGRAGLALQVLASESRQKQVQDATKLATAAAARDEYTMVCLLAAYEGRGDEDRLGRERLLADVVYILDAALKGATAKDLPKILPAVAALLIPVFQDTRRQLQGNAAPKIAFSALAASVAVAGA